MPISQVPFAGISNPVNFRNRIINGNMQIDQRNAGASVSPSDTYTLDRWQGFASVASKYTVQQNAGSVTPPVGFTNYLGVTSSSAYSVGASERFAISQKIEGFNSSDLAWGTANAQPVTLSFWVRSSLTGTFGGVFTNSAYNRSYPYTYTISSANTWEYKTVTIAGDTSGTWLATNSVGLQVWFGLGVGSSLSGTAGSWSGSTFLSATGATSVVGTNGATFYITGVQLEAGGQASGFEFMPIDVNLGRCQRYYQNTFNTGNIPGTSTSPLDAVFVSAWNDGNSSIPRFNTIMRASPTVTLRPSSSTTTGQVNSNGTNRSATASEISTKGVSYIAITSGAANVYVGFTYEASAEL
jgi:hypothetical protein